MYVSNEFQFCQVYNFASLLYGYFVNQYFTINIYIDKVEWGMFIF